MVILNDNIESSEDEKDNRTWVNPKAGLSTKSARLVDFYNRRNNYDAAGVEAL
jgi:hypothetical protein